MFRRKLRQSLLSQTHSNEENCPVHVSPTWVKPPQQWWRCWRGAGVSVPPQLCGSATNFTASLETPELLTICCFTVASSHLPGLRTCDLGHLGVPTAEEYSQMYCDHMGMELPENWNFYMAFAFFRLAAVLQALHKRSLAGEEPNRGSPAQNPRAPGWGELSHQTREIRPALCAPGFDTS